MRSSIALPAGARLVGERETGLIVNQHGQGLYHWERGASSGEPIAETDLAAPAGSVEVAEMEPNRLTLVDDRGHRVAVESPIDGDWRRHHSFSPDGRHLAVDLDISGPREEISMSDVISDIIEGRSMYEPVPHRLAIIDSSDGSVRIAEGEFDNFASTLVWSHDSEWVLFAAPFTPRGLWSCNVADARLEWIGFGRSTPVPLVNVSDLIAD